jgi:hypothetical protein
MRYPAPSIIDNMWVVYLVEHYATSQKLAGSIPDEVIAFFQFT